MARIDTHSETSLNRGWRWVVEVRDDSGQSSTHTVSLSWQDHDHWCGGSLSPSRMVERVVEYCLEHGREPLPATFDAARARRWFPAIDRELRSCA